MSRLKVGDPVIINDSLSPFNGMTGVVEEIGGETDLAVYLYVDLDGGFGSYLFPTWELEFDCLGICDGTCDVDSSVSGLGS